MRRLFPEPAGEVDPVDAYDVPPAPEGRPFVRCNMISSVDGAIAVRGRSGMLGGPADRRLFHALRSLSDVILVGAGTMRAEGYGPARLADDLRERRAARGRPPVPPIAVVTRSCAFDWSAPFFTDAEERPLVVTTDECPEDARRRAEDVADVVVAGDQQVDLGVALAQLHDRGHRSVLLEGGPRLNAQMVDAGLLDELCLTFSPRLVSGDGPRVLAGRELPSPLQLDTVQVLEADGFFFYRLAVRR